MAESIIKKAPMDLKSAIKKISYSTLTWTQTDGWYRVNIAFSTLSLQNVKFVQVIGWSTHPCFAQMDNEGEKLALFSLQNLSSGYVNVEIFYE